MLLERKPSLSDSWPKLEVSSHYPFSLLLLRVSSLGNLLLGSMPHPSTQLSKASVVAPLPACCGEQVLAAQPLNLCRDLALFSEFM